MNNSDFRLNPAGEGATALRLGAGAIGSVDTFVALFSGVASPLGPPVVADWLVQVNSPTLGSTFKITRRGVYLVSFFLDLTGAAANSVGLGISLDYSGPPQPVGATQVVAYTGVTAAADVMSLNAVGMVSVPQSAANDAALGIVRCLLDNNAGAAVDPLDVVINSGVVRIVRIADLNSES